MEYDNKKSFDHQDERQDDRNLAHPLKDFPNDNETESEYKRLSNELDELRAHMSQINERKKQINLINDQVGGWCARVGQKLADQTDDHTL